jgi:REP element-mobilizing transposase RayT
VRDGRHFQEGCYYHLGSRGNFRQAIVADDFDRQMWVDLLGAVTRTTDWLILAYCLMTNHFHLVVQAGRSSVSDAMQVLNGEFSRRANRRSGRQGHLFENRFHAEPIRSDAHLLAACRYVDRNPCRAGICACPGEWEWSGYRASVGAAHPPAFLAVGELLGLFGRDPGRARAAYRQFVLSGHATVSDTGFWAGA